MIKPLLSFALSALLFPVVAHAAVINIDYTGYVSATEGAGMGYNIGDAVNGHLQVDLTKVPQTDTNPPAGNYAANYVAYYAPENEHDVISGYHTQAVGKSADFLEVIDDGYLHNGTVEDFLKVSDSDSEFILDADFNFTANNFYSFYLEVLLPGFDWFSGSNLENVNLYITDATVLTNSFAQMYNVFVTGNTTNYNVQPDVARITLDSLHITAVDVPQVTSTANVPESNALVLFILALAGVWIGRARNKAAIRNYVRK